jgi:hypothetical protein
MCSADVAIRSSRSPLRPAAAVAARRSPLPLQPPLFVTPQTPCNASRHHLRRVLRDPSTH